MVSADKDTNPSEACWPYVVPYFAFLLVVELAAYFPTGLAFLTLILKPSVPALLLGLFFCRGAYPELRCGNFSAPTMLGDIGVGIVSGCLWIGPYLLLPALRPDTSQAFDPYVAGPELVGWVLALRFTSFALVTPVFEELFIRSFVMRYAQAWSNRSDFRDVPIGHYSMPGFIATAVVFTITHLPWEYWVAVPWIVLTNLYFYWRRNLWGLILVHAGANAFIFSLVVFVAIWHETPQMFPSLWFFL